MATTVAIRPFVDDDLDAIVATVRRVIEETYADLLTGPAPVDASTRFWRGAVVAETAGGVVGVGRRVDDYVSDLWVAASMRGEGVGATLLDALEGRMRRDGVTVARLRVVTANTDARRFYRRAGWVETRRYPHERDGHMMTDMEKRLSVL
ncbi:MAG: GNAT family N-acetyltransferase [Pseudomonadota bacterium]